jgi:hypothetical protein
MRRRPRPSNVFPYRVVNPQPGTNLFVIDEGWWNTPGPGGVVAGQAGGDMMPQEHLRRPGEHWVVWEAVNVPEPSTLASLGVGLAILFRKVQQSRKK